MQEGAGAGRERKRDTNTGVSGKGTLPHPKTPGYRAGMSRVASAPAPALFPILTLGCPSKEQLQNTALSQAGDGPLCSGQSYLERAAAGGRQGCMLASPQLASPAGARDGSRRHPTGGDAEPEEGLSHMAEGMETSPQHICGLQGWPPHCDKESPTGEGLREGGFAHADSHQGSS